MTKRTLLILVGVLIFIVPFLGFPQGFSTMFIQFLGLVVLLAGIFSARADTVKTETNPE